MKLASELVMREIAGETILIPVGELTKKYNGLLTMNDTGAFILGKLREECTFEMLLSGLLEEFDVLPDRAEADLKALLDRLAQMQLLE